MGAASFAKDQLKAFVERIERLEEEKKATSDDIRDVYAEAKGSGFDARALRTIIKMRRQDPDDRREQEEIVDTYLQALGMLPLFEHAARRGDDTKVTISAGGKSVETTTGALQKAARSVSGKNRKRGPQNMLAAG